MSIESLILDLTTAVRENTDSNNKLILLMQGDKPVVAAEKKPKKAAATKVKESAKPKEEKQLELEIEPEAKETPKAKPEAKETPKAKPEAKKSDDSGSDQVADLYKMMQERLIALVTKYEKDDDSTPKEAHTKAVAFMKEKNKLYSLR